MSAVVSAKVKSRRCHLCGETESSCFSFPKEDERRKAWLLFCNITDSKKISVPYLCEKHFENELIIRNIKKPGLRGHAVPTITVESKSISEDEETEPPKKKRLKHCCVCGPTATNLHLHKFPVNENRRNEWLDSINMTGDKRTDLRLCNLHFPANCISKTAKGRILLTCDAKPVLTDRTNAIDTSSPLNPIAVGRMRQSLSRMLNHERIGAASMEMSHNDTEVNISNALGTKSAELEESTKVELQWEMAEPSTRIGAESMEISHNDTEVNISYAFGTKSAELEESTKVELQWEMAGPSTRVGAESMEMSHNDSEMTISNTLQTHMCSAELEERTDVEFQWELTEPSTSGTPGIMRTPTTSKSSSAIPRKRHIRFLGDINTPSLNSPSTRRKCLSVIRTHRLAMEKKMKIMRQKTSRMKSKITNMKSLLTNLKNKKMISEDAASSLLVCISSFGEFF